MRILKYLISLCILIFMSFSLGCEKKSDTYSNLHIEDYKLVLRNKDLDETKIKKDTEKLADRLIKYISDSDKDSVKTNMINNSYNSVKNEWGRIKDNNITSIDISDSIDTKLFSEQFSNDVNSKEFFSLDHIIIILKAMSNNDVKFVQAFIYSKDPHSDKFFLDLKTSNNTNNSETYNKILGQVLNENFKNVK